MQVVSIISTKGGVGKTTTAANLGGLAEAGLAGFLGPSDAQQINDRQQRAQTRQPIDDIGDQRVGADAEVVNGDP